MPALPSPPRRFIILVSLSAAYYDFFLNWLQPVCGFGLVTHVMAIAEDALAFQMLRKHLADHQVQRGLYSSQGQAFFSCGGASAHSPVCQQLGSAALSNSKQGSTGGEYNSTGFRVMMGSRPHYILRYLRAGHEVLFSDLDTVWLGNPMALIRLSLEKSTGTELLVVADTMKVTHANGTVDVLGTGFCGCFIFFRPTAGSLQLVEQWAERTGVGTNQVAFNGAIRQMRGQGLRLRQLPRLSFPPGVQYFANEGKVHFPRALVVHANWVVGSNVKIERLRGAELWHPTENRCVSSSVASAQHP